KERCKQLQELAEPMTVVFDRAFDRCKDPKQALEDVIELGFDRVLTSGLRNTAVEGKDLLKALVLQASGRIEIMPGAGVNEENIIDLLNHTGAKSIDRKSTRLNSSHVKISYAVFCLKKKRRIQTRAGYVSTAC